MAQRSTTHRSRAGSLPVVSLILGAIGVLSGFEDNFAVLAFGVAGFVLGSVARSKDSRTIATLGIVLSAVALGWYLGILLQQRPIV